MIKRAGGDDRLHARSHSSRNQQSTSTLTYRMVSLAFFHLRVEHDQNVLAVLIRSNTNRRLTLLKERAEHHRSVVKRKNAGQLIVHYQRCSHRTRAA